MYTKFKQIEKERVLILVSDVVYGHGCMYRCTCACVCVCVCMYVYVHVYVCVHLGILGTGCGSRIPSFPSWQPVCVCDCKCVSKEWGAGGDENEGKGEDEEVEKVR